MSMKVFGSISRLVSILFRKDSQDITFRPNQGTTYSAARDVQLPPGDAAHVLVSADSTQTLTNKTISGSGNTLSNIAITSLLTVLGDADKVLLRDGSGVVTSAKIVDANVASGAAINAAKIANGAVSNTEFQYLDGVTSAIQTQLDGKLALSGGTLTGALTLAADPASALQAATKQYVDHVAQGLKPKEAVRAATTANIDLSTGLVDTTVIDGVTLATGDRVLVKAQTAAAENGIYIVAASGAASRATDFDSLSPIDEINGASVGIQEGSQAGQNWIQTGKVTTLDSDAINFVYFNSVGSLVGGDMITVSGSTISVDLAAASGLESSNPGNAAGQLRVKLEASNPSLKFSGSNELAAKLDAAGAITSGASGLKVGVDGSTIDISGNALEVKAGGITDTQVSASAAISLSKIQTFRFAADWITADGTTKAITHSLGTKDIHVQLWDKSDDSMIMVDSIVATSTSVVTLTASEAPGASGWRVVIIAG